MWPNHYNDFVNFNVPVYIKCSKCKCVLQAKVNKQPGAKCRCGGYYKIK